MDGLILAWQTASQSRLVGALLVTMLRRVLASYGWTLVLIWTTKGAGTEGTPHLTKEELRTMKSYTLLTTFVLFASLLL